MKVDVVISVYGKPWQTLSTLKSLIAHSGEHIDKIYFLEEAKHPFGDKVDWVMNYFDNIIHYKPEKHVNPYSIPSSKVPYSNIRHQYAIDNSDKKYLFITHNDVLYTGDIIGNMLSNIKDTIGIGQIGQCWNCPLNNIGKCSGDKFYEVNITSEDIENLKLPYIRTRRDNLDKDIPRLMPECRLNEFACLIDREVCKKEGHPYFGDFDEDSGTAWFKAMYKKGYKFTDYRKDFHHAYWIGVGGHEVEQKDILYQKAEENAKKYYEENLK